MSEPERESMEVDVLFVGAGPATLASAYHLMKQVEEQNAQAEKKGTPQIEPPVILVIEKAAGSGVAGGFPRVLLVSGGGNIACNGQYELTAQVSGSCRRPIYAHLDESGVSIRWSQAGEMWVFDHPDGSPYKCDDRDDIAAPLDGWSCFGTNLLGRGKAPVIAAASEDELSGLALLRAARSNDIAAVRERLLDACDAVGGVARRGSPQSRPSDWSHDKE